MKNLLYSKQMPAILAILAVIIFFAWSFIEGTYKHAWLIFIVAGLAQLVIKAAKDKDNGNNS